MSLCIPSVLNSIGPCTSFRLRPEFAERGVYEKDLSLYYLCGNSHPRAFDILRTYLERVVERIDAGEAILENRYADFIDWEALSENPCTKVVDWLFAHPKYINFQYFSKNTNPDALAFLEKNPHHIFWCYLSGNQTTAAVALLRKNPEAISWYYLSGNPHPSAVELILENLDSIDWRQFSTNTHPDAVALLVTRPDAIDFDLLSANNNAEAVAFLMKTPENINEYYIAHNSNPVAVAWMVRFVSTRAIDPLVYANLEFNENPDALALLAKNTRLPAGLEYHCIGENHTLAALNIMWNMGELLYDAKWAAVVGDRTVVRVIPRNVSGNPYIFEEVYDYAAILAKMDLLREDLAKAVGHPLRLMRYLDAGGEIDDF